MSNNERPQQGKRMSIEELAKLGEWTQAGDIPRCRGARCFKLPTNFVKVKIKGQDEEMIWYFCHDDFMAYLRARDAEREIETATLNTQPSDERRIV